MAQFALILNTLAKDKEISDRWRGFADIADERHLSNRVEREVVDALVAAVRAAYPRLSHRYYALKAKWFGKKRLPQWDRNAPLPQFQRLGRGQGYDTHRLWRVLAENGDDRRAVFCRALDRPPVRPGRHRGRSRFESAPTVHPFVLLNYRPQSRDVMTLAHELGHGVHQVPAARSGLHGADPADDGGDGKRLRRDAHVQRLSGVPTTKDRQAMLSGKVEDMFATVFRQVAFYSFELAVHRARQPGRI